MKSVSLGEHIKSLGSIVNSVKYLLASLVLYYQSLSLLSLSTEKYALFAYVPLQRGTLETLACITFSRK